LRQRITYLSEFEEGSVLSVDGVEAPTELEIGRVTGSGDAKREHEAVKEDINITRKSKDLVSFHSLGARKNEGHEPRPSIESKESHMRISNEWNINGQ
jgi:hypothetical protein